jgi:hypothetical protein
VGVFEAPAEDERRELREDACMNKILPMSGHSPAAVTDARRRLFVLAYCLAFLFVAVNMTLISSLALKLALVEGGIAGWLTCLSVSVGLSTCVLGLVVSVKAFRMRDIATGLSIGADGLAVLPRSRARLTWRRRR